MIIPLLSIIYNSASKFHSAALEALNNFKTSFDEKARHQHLMEAVKFLNRDGGFEINVSAIQGTDGEKDDTEIHVSIVYKVWPRKESEDYIELHTSYCVDFSSWTALAKDLRILEQKYLEVFQRVHGEIDEDFADFDRDFSKYRVPQSRMVIDKENSRTPK